MSDTDKHLRKILRDRFDDSKSHSECERCIATASKLGYTDLADEMKSDLQVTELDTLA